MTNCDTLISAGLLEAQDELARFIRDEATLPSIAAAAQMMADTLAGGGKIIACGNGGSLCDAAHFAEELTGRFRNSRHPLPAIAVNDPAYLTCTSNDFSYEEVFSRYVEGVGCPGDVLLCISTSGRSGNVLMAARAARKRGMKVVALTSAGGEELARTSDVTVAAPDAPHSDRIQEIHIKVIHLLIQCIENILGC